MNRQLRTSNSSSTTSSNSLLLSHWDSSSSLSYSGESNNMNEGRQVLNTSGENSHFPTVVFICQPKSHPFLERWVPLSGGPTNPIKVGRLVARIKPSTNNAIFDCKVLSRNHAILWFEDNKVWLKDTKSSNGTFVNGIRLSKGSEESPPKEIYSGDIVQFGVEVVENQVTHGCIISQVTVYNADGSELKKKCEEEVNDGQSHYLSNYSPNQEQIYQLAQYLEEALFREKAMERKMQTLQSMLVEVECSAESTWQVLLNEDRLLSKLKSLESQLDIFSSNDSPESLKSKAARAVDEREKMEQKFEAMQDELLNEKMKLLERLSEVELLLANSEEECSHLRRKCEEMDGNLIILNETFRKKAEELEDLQKILLESESSYSAEISALCHERDEFKNRVNEMQDLINILQDQVERLETDKSQMEVEYSGLKDQIDMMKNIPPSEQHGQFIVSESAHLQGEISNSEKENAPILNEDSAYNTNHSIAPQTACVSSSSYEEQKYFAEIEKIYNHIMMSKEIKTLPGPPSENIETNDPANLLKDVTEWLETIILEPSNYPFDFDTVASSPPPSTTTTTASSAAATASENDANEHDNIKFYLNATHSQLHTCRLLSLDSLQHLHQRLSHLFNTTKDFANQAVQVDNDKKDVEEETENKKDESIDKIRVELINELDNVIQCLVTYAVGDQQAMFSLTPTSFNSPSVRNLVDLLKNHFSNENCIKETLFSEIDNLKTCQGDLESKLNENNETMELQLSDCRQQLQSALQLITTWETNYHNLSKENENQLILNQNLTAKMTKLKEKFKEMKVKENERHQTKLLKRDGLTTTTTSTAAEEVPEFSVKHRMQFGEVIPSECSTTTATTTSSSNNTSTTRNSNTATATAPTTTSTIIPSVNHSTSSTSTSNPNRDLSPQARMMSAVAVVPIMLFLCVFMFSFYFWITAPPEKEMSGSSSHRTSRPL